MKSSITKYIVGGVVVLALVAYLIFSDKSSAPAPTATTNSTSSNGMGMTDAEMAAMTPTSTAAGYKDGTYTGSVADAFYGNLQVSVTIKGGLITDVTFPQSPSDGSHTQQVSATALPVLKQEAITTQSANVNTVSGATQDSEAFNQSLAAALAQAK